MPNTVRVYPDGDVWVVKRDETTKAAAIRNTQREAFEVAREIALNKGLSVTVHGPNGKIQKVIYPQDRSSSGGGGCFLSTACIETQNLPDNCYELQLLRKFRDDFVLNLPKGKQILKKYYRIAPEIISAINQNKNRKKVYENLFKNIQQSCKLIERNRFNDAFLLYANTVKQLSIRFKIK